jgi:hypothetical protein
MIIYLGEPRPDAGALKCTVGIKPEVLFTLVGTRVRAYDRCDGGHLNARLPP